MAKASRGAVGSAGRMLGLFVCLSVCLISFGRGAGCSPVSGAAAELDEQTLHSDVRITIADRGSDGA